MYTKEEGTSMQRKKNGTGCRAQRESLAGVGLFSQSRGMGEMLGEGILCLRRKGKDWIIL